MTKAAMCVCVYEMQQCETDRLLLTFASAVAVVSIATPSCWRRNGGVGMRVAWRGTWGGTGPCRGRWIINRHPHSVTSPASDREVNGAGRRLLLTLLKGSRLAVAVDILWFSFSLLIHPLLFFCVCACVFCFVSCILLVHVLIVGPCMSSQAWHKFPLFW